MHSVISECRFHSSNDEPLYKCAANVLGRPLQVFRAHVSRFIQSLQDFVPLRISQKYSEAVATHR